MPINPTHRRKALTAMNDIQRFVTIVQAMTPGQIAVVEKAINDVTEGQASLGDEVFCHKVQADLDKARSLNR